MQTIPSTPFHVVQLPLYIKSESSLKRIIGNKDKLISAVHQGVDISVPLSPDNPLLNRVNLHAKPSNRLILHVVKDGDKVSGSIIGAGKYCLYLFNVVKSEYSTNDLCDFGFLPERQYYDITENNGIIPHYDLFDRNNDPYVVWFSLILVSFTSRNSAFMTPIRFTSYTAPYDINMRDVSSERGIFRFLQLSLEKRQSKPYHFINSDAPSIPLTFAFHLFYP